VMRLRILAMVSLRQGALIQKLTRVVLMKVGQTKTPKSLRVMYAGFKLITVLGLRLNHLHLLYLYQHCLK
jgi:hypothetical protein